MVALLAAAPPASAAQPGVGLGTATSYAVLAGSTITNTGPTTISGDVGLHPGTATPGLSGAMVSDGVIHAADAPALQAQSDLTTAYDDAAGRSPVVDKTGQDLAGQTLVPGVYDASSSLGLTGTVTLDAQGDPSAVFILRAGSTLITAAGSSVALIGGAQACHVYWQVGSSATLGVGSSFVGSVLALTDITLGTGAVVQGRVLARNGQVALDTNTINRPSCAVAPVPTATASPTATPVATPSPSTSDSTGSDSTGPGSTGPGSTGDGSGDGGDGGDGGNGGNGGGGDGSGPPIPVGHPETGHADSATSVAWLVAGLACLTGATAAAGAGLRGRRRTPAGRHT